MSFLRFFSFLGKYKDIANVTKMIVPKSTWGQKAADGLTTFVGSWKFILLVIFLMIAWIAINVYLIYFQQWDPYPFILLNFVLSCMAALEAPVILMSQNRHAEIDRVRAEYDYQVNIKAEKEIQDMQKDLEQIKIMISNLNTNNKKK